MLNMKASFPFYELMKEKLFENTKKVWILWIEALAL